MNILINCSNLKIGGGLQVAHSFILSIKKFNTHNFTIVLSSALEKQIVKEEFPKNINFVTYNISAKAINSFIGKNNFLNELVIKSETEVVFSVFGPTYWKPKVKHIVGYAKPHYIYTDSPFFRTQSALDLLKLKLKKYFHLYDFKNNNEILITENIDVTNRLRNILKDKEIHTVTNYYNQIFDLEKDWDRSIILPKDKEFSMLTVSANYPHKNLQIIPKVIDVLNRKYKGFKFKFVLTLNKGALNHNLGAMIDEQIEYLGKININQCPYLYVQSDAVFLPTLLECFTATYPEAMRMRKPILTSKINFATGLCGNAAEYYDPLNPEEIAEKIYALAINNKMQEKLIANGLEQLKKYDSYTMRTEKYMKIITQ